MIRAPWFPRCTYTLVVLEYGSWILNGNQAFWKCRLVIFPLMRIIPFNENPSVWKKNSGKRWFHSFEFSISAFFYIWNVRLSGHVSLETVDLVVGGGARVAGGREVNPTRQGLSRPSCIANDLTLAKKLLVMDKPHLHDNIKCLTSFISTSPLFKRSFLR